MIPVTTRMLRVHAELWTLTDGGTKEWTGTVKIDGIPGPSIHDALFWLRKRKAIDWRRTSVRNNLRTFRVDVGPDALTLTGSRPRQAPHSWDGRTGLTDRGLFSEAFEKAHPGEQFDSVTLKPTPVYVPQNAGGWAR